MTSQNTSLLPTEENHFKAYRTPWIGILALIIGGTSLVFAIWLMLLEGIFNSGSIVGIVVTAAGYLWLTRPYFAIAPNRLTIYNPIGYAIKRYPFKSFGNLTIKGNYLYIEDTLESTSKRVNINKNFTKPADWNTLEAITNHT